LEKQRLLEERDILVDSARIRVGQKHQLEEWS